MVLVGDIGCLLHHSMVPKPAGHSQQRGSSSAAGAAPTESCKPPSVPPVPDDWDDEVNPGGDDEVETDP